MSASTKRSAIILIVGLVIGVTLGYIVAFQLIDTSGLEQQISQLEDQVNNLQSRLESKNTQISNLQSQISNLQNQLKNKNAQIANLQAQIKDKNAQINTLQGLLESKNTQISNLQSQISDLQNQLENKNVRIANLQAQIKDKNMQIDALQDKIVDLQSQIEKLEALVPPLRKGEWNTIITFTGSAFKTTELFHIPSGTWRINWTYKGGELAGFSFFVYPEGETMYIETLMTMGSSKSDTTYIYKGPGNYYIKVLATNIKEWTITIEAFVPEKS